MRRLTNLFILICGLTACNEQSNFQQQPQTLNFDQTIFLNDQPLKVVVFDTPVEREQGLMWVKELPKDHGALFVFEQEATVSFWMKNTLTPLDLLFFDANYQLTELVSAAPPCSLQCVYYTVAKTRYVLELGADASKHLKVKKFNQLIRE